MKVKEIDNKKSFEPIKLEFTIESEDELLELYHRFNSSKDSVQIDSHSSEYPFYEEDCSMELYEAVQRLCKKHIK